MKKSQRLVFIVAALLVSLGLQAKIYSAKTHLSNQKQRDTYLKAPEQINRDNLQHLEDFIAMEVEGRSTLSINNVDADDAKFLNPRIARDVLSTLRSHSVVSLYSYDKYDPKNQGIGFCFGRAMFVHLELAMRNLDRDSIKKAFVVGSMSTGDGNSWGWHVTTIAQSKDQNGNEVWLALDPVTGLKTLKEWYKEMYNHFSTDKKLKIYVTESGKFGPSPGFYSHPNLENQFYNSYFTDLDKEFVKASMAGKYDNPIPEYIVE
ncbi:MAG: hypothetical protein HN509_09755 [Halobacteriovoraceae bacterium]|jgi:hypothetical protein|nr:hypothetical protein [Halobacteriovoraceae bacterium]MBT5093889.1 hypothetical protein [Halobacteriovoraceae bacterium]